MASLNAVWMSELKKQENKNKKVNAATSIQKGKQLFLKYVLSIVLSSTLISTLSFIYS